MKKLLTEKGLNLLQVAVFWSIVLYFLASSKIHVLKQFQLTIVMIGVGISMFILAYKFIVIDKKSK